MTKVELINTLSKKTGIEMTIVTVIINAFATEVSTQLLNGNSVHMRGFGSFVVKHKAQRMGRLINKNRKLIIPPHDEPAFKPSDILKKKMKDRTIRAAQTLNNEPQA